VSFCRSIHVIKNRASRDCEKSPGWCPWPKADSPVGNGSDSDIRVAVNLQWWRFCSFPKRCVSLLICSNHQKDFPYVRISPVAILTLLLFSLSIGRLYVFPVYEILPFFFMVFSRLHNPDSFMNLFRNLKDFYYIHISLNCSLSTILKTGYSFSS